MNKWAIVSIVTAILATLFGIVGYTVFVTYKRKQMRERERRLRVEKLKAGVIADAKIVMAERLKKKAELQELSLRGIRASDVPMPVLPHAVPDRWDPNMWV